MTSRMLSVYTSVNYIRNNDEAILLYVFCHRVCTVSLVLVPFRNAIGQSYFHCYRQYLLENGRTVVTVTFCSLFTIQYVGSFVFYFSRLGALPSSELTVFFYRLFAGSILTYPNLSVCLDNPFALSYKVRDFFQFV